MDRFYGGANFHTSIAKQLGLSDKQCKEADQPGLTDEEVANALVRIIRRDIRSGKMPGGTCTVIRNDGSEIIAWPVSEQ